MNAIVDLLLELKEKHVNISVEGDQLRCAAAPGVLTSDLRERLTAYKPEIIRFLSNAPTSPSLDSPEQAPEAVSHVPGLSRSQSSIWLLEQINPGTCIWNVPNAFAIHGVLDHSALEASFHALMERHDTLRSRFVLIDGAPSMVLAPVDSWSMDILDLRGRPDAESQAAALTTAEAQRPFDLERGPLFRVRLLRTADTAHVLVVVLHHIIADGWSLGIVSQELTRLYEAQLRGTAPRLPPLRADYQAFVRQSRSEEAATQGDLDWWRERLAGELPIVSLATDPTHVLSGAGRRVAIQLGSDVTAGIERLARQHRATPFMVLLAVFKLLIHRTSGESDLLIAVAISGRDRPEYAETIGLFVNTLALRTTVTPDLSFAELLDRVRETSLDAFARQRVSFDRVVEAVRPPRQTGANPLTRLSFAYQNFQPPPLRLGAAELTRLPLELAGARHELLVEVWKTVAGLSCEFEYSTDLFDAPTIERLMGHYRTLIEAVLTDHPQHIGMLPLLTDAERHDMLTVWNDTRTTYAAERRLEAMFADQAVATPDAPALIHRGRTLSYRDLDRRANQLAHCLLALGVGPEVLVGVCLERSPDLVVAILAVLKAGGAYVPLDPAYPAERLAFMLEDSAAPVLITRATLSQALTYTGHIVDLDTEQAAIATRPDSPPQADATAENLAYVIYTSGSTGHPKGVMLRHSAGYLIDWARRSFPPEYLTRVVAGTSICFDPSVFELFVPLCTGGAVILVDNFLEKLDPASQPSLLITVPSAFAEMVRAGNIPDSVRLMIIGGEKLKNTLVQMLYQTTRVAQVYNVYGPTEYTTCAIISLAGRGVDHDPPIGRPLTNTQVYVLDSQRQLVPVGVVGELFIAGDGLARGYLNRPELTAERFPKNPFGPVGSRMYRSGDLVRWSADGQLEFIGRADHQVKLRGFRIELGEIEAALLRHPAVRDAVVIVRHDRPDDTRLTAYVVAVDDAPMQAELRQHLKSWLPEHMIPATFVVLPQFPLNQSGKVDRNALPASEAVLPKPETDASPSRMTPIEDIVAEAFRDVLDVERVDAQSNFFDLGGHSLLAVKVAARIEHMLAQPVSPALIFQAPTPHLLAPLLDATLAPTASHVTPLQPLGDRPPIFCLHDLFSRPLRYVSLARHLAPDQPMYGLAPGPLEEAIIAEPRLDMLTSAYVDAIKSIQPNGPYRVAGYSYGGLTAFDLAQSLFAKGEDVLLIMIDPYIYRSKPTILQTARWAWRHRHWVLKKVDTQWFRRKLARARDRLLKRRGDPSMVQLPGWVPPNSRALAIGLLQAQANYRFRPYQGSTVFLQGTNRAPEEDFLNADGLNGWGDLLKGPVSRHTIYADHYWLMRDPLVSEVANILRSCDACIGVSPSLPELTC